MPKRPLRTCDNCGALAQWTYTPATADKREPAVCDDCLQAKPCHHGFEDHDDSGKVVWCCEWDRNFAGFYADGWPVGVRRPLIPRQVKEPFEYFGYYIGWPAVRFVRYRVLQPLLRRSKTA